MTFPVAEAVPIAADVDPARRGPVSLRGMFPLARSVTLVLLLAAAVVQQARYVGRAVLPAQDAVDVVSVAQRIEREGLPATVRAEPVPPLFPALVAAAHTTLYRAGVIERSDWARPPQLVAAAALVLAVVPVFFTAELLAGRLAAVCATIFFITLPAVARLGGDGLGDALHLCLASWAAWLLCAACRGGRIAWVGAGLFLAAALLVRVEAAFLVIAVGLLAVRRPEFRRPRFFAAASLCLVPYFACGVASPSGIVERLRGGAAPSEDAPLNDSDFWFSPGASWLDAARGLPLTFGHKDRTRSTRFHGFAGTVREFVDEGLAAFGYVLPLLMVGGMRLRRRDSAASYDRFVLVAVALALVVLFGTAWRNGYLSTRHFLLPLALLLPYAGLGVVALSQRLVPGRSFVHEGGPRPTVAAFWASLRRRPETAFVAAFATIALFATARPLHESSAAHRRAAEWLRTVAAPGNVLEQHGYTALYTGRTTFRFDAAETAFFDADLRYVLIERGDLEADSPRGRSLRTMLGTAERSIARFAAPRGRTERDVLVFTRPPWNFAHREQHYAR